MAFKKIQTQTVRPTDPESLFRDLPITDPKIQSLWSHQADILREYNKKNIKSEDIAIELPTGTGKTLIGLLIGEFRRRAFDERVVYLCPTKQLVYQIQDQASKYGINAHAFVGSQSTYSISAYAEYLSGKAIAITTYSGLFNTNPKLKDANVIILDDAHAGENYIVSMWSVEIKRDIHSDLFKQIVHLFEDKISSYFLESLLDENSRHKDVFDMIPAPTFWERLDNLRSLINENLDNSFSYPWSVIQQNLAASNVFLSSNKILIRPWIPPTRTHEAFANATQRIYMSATLGAGGELERIIGIPKIDRLPVPAGWDKQGSGRRFFIFPNQSFAPKDYIPWVTERICNQNRTLVLCPNTTIADAIGVSIRGHCPNISMMSSGNIEISLDPFTKHSNAALILTSRYDGIDLPDDSCRQLIIAGNPDAINLQERFILKRLGIYSLLKDRIITRFTQAAGRCTRGVRDYSMVILVGEDLHTFCLKNENLGGMHPELQAELKFGLENSSVSSVDELSELCELFLEQGDEWKKQDQYIKDIRHGCTVSIDDRSKTLIKIVKDEVDFQYYLWKGDYNRALKSAQNVVDKLSGDDFKTYRGLWYYFGGCCAWQLSRSSPNDGFEKIVEDYFDRAVSCIDKTSWFSNVTLPPKISITKDEMSVASIYSVENIKNKIIKYGITGKTFEGRMSKIRDFVYSDDPKKFEEGITQLGSLLGFDTTHPPDQAAPDSVWQITDSLLILFEAKSQQTGDDGIPVDTCREARGHYKWAKSNISGFDKIGKKIVVVVPNRTNIEKQAMPFADNLYFMHITRIREIFEDVSGVYRRIRGKYATYNEEEINSKILEELIQKKLDPENLIKEMVSVPLNKMQQRSNS